MCLAIPGKLIEITSDKDATFKAGRISFNGIIKEVNLSMVPEAKLNDYVLVHVGVAITIIDEEEANITLGYLKQMGELNNEIPE